MELPPFVVYLSAGAYIAIMLAVMGVPQLLSSYFDLKARRIERAENEANTERRHRETLEANARREEQQEERRHEERLLEEERRRDEAEMANRRHQELMALLIAALNSAGNHGNGQSELIRTLQQTIEDLRTENERLRRQNGNGGESSA